jgi:hypothetical protein
MPTRSGTFVLLEELPLLLLEKYGATTLYNSYARLGWLIIRRYYLQTGIKSPMRSRLLALGPTLIVEW